MNHVGFALSFAVVILGGCASTASSPARGDDDPSQSADHARILRIFDEISIPLGTPKAEVQRLLPFPVEAPAASSEALLQYDGQPEKEEVIYAVAVDGVFLKVGGLRWTHKTGQRGSLESNPPRNDPYVHKTTSAQCGIQGEGRLGGAQEH